MNKFIKFGKDFSMITQLGLSIISPIVLCVFGGNFLKNKFDLGNWVIFVSIVMGIGGAISSMMAFYKYVMKNK